MMMGLASEMNADPDQQVSAHKNGNKGDFDPQNHTIGKYFEVFQNFHGTQKFH